MKQLSIIVPAYNMQAYLPQCIESILRAPSRAGLEIVIVNDGSTDKTLQIANRYAEQFVDTIRVVDKENGNYGSTINAALPLVQGEYVKILDADDMLNGSGIAEALSYLRKVQGVDMVVTPYIEVGKHTQHRVGYDLFSRKVYENGKIFDADNVFAGESIRFFTMHGVCYRTEFLREIGYKQSEGLSYTDQEWAFYPIFKVKTMAFLDVPLYRYNTTREGRTMDAAVQMRHLSQLVTVTERMAQYFVDNEASLESAHRREFLRRVVANRLRIAYRKYLLEMSDKAFAASDFIDVHRRLSKLAAESGIGELQVPVNNMLKVDLLGYWHLKGKRYAAIYRLCLRMVDGLMSWGHALLFRRN